MSHSCHRSSHGDRHTKQLPPAAAARCGTRLGPTGGGTPSPNEWKFAGGDAGDLMLVLGWTSDEMARHYGLARRRRPIQSLYKWYKFGDDLGRLLSVMGIPGYALSATCGHAARRRLSSVVLAIAGMLNFVAATTEIQRGTFARTAVTAEG